MPSDSKDNLSILVVELENQCSDTLKISWCCGQSEIITKIIRLFQTFQEYSILINQEYSILIKRFGKTHHQHVYFGQTLEYDQNGSNSWHWRIQGILWVLEYLKFFPVSVNCWSVVHVHRRSGLKQLYPARAACLSEWLERKCFLTHACNPIAHITFMPGIRVEISDRK